MHSNKPKILFIVRDNANSAYTWSGIPNHIIKIFKEYHHNFITLDQLGFPKNFVWRLKNKLSKFSKHFAPKYYSPSTAQYYGKMISKKIKNLEYDLIFAIDFIEGISEIQTEKPIFVFKDASYIQLNEINYPGFEKFTPSDIVHLHESEKLGAKRSNLILLTSEWAIDNFKRIHPETNANKFIKVPFSGQVYPPPLPNKSRSVDRNKVIKFLFVGRAWERKGGPKVLKILNILNEMGLTVSLDIVGSVPFKENPYDFDINLHGDLDKNNEEQNSKLNSLYDDSHFFIFPTFNDCSPIVTIESLSYGLPVITHHVGGTPEIIKNGECGICLPPATSERIFAEEIEEIINSPSQYSKIVKNSISKFESEFHPKTFVDNVIKTYESFVSK